MPLAQAVITFDISDLASADFDARRTKIYATTNVPGGAVIDTDGNHIYLGSGTTTISTDGTGTISVPVPGAGSNPASWQTSIHVDYPDRNADRGRSQRTFGPFTVTTAANLADLVAEMPVQPEYLATVLATVQDMIDDATSGTAADVTALEALVSGYTDHGNVSGAVAIDPTIGTHVLDATAPTTLTIGAAANGTLVSVLAITGAADVTIAGIADAELTDNAFATFARIRGAWKLGAASGTPSVPDATPPSAVTDLAATGGEEEIDLTWSAATDPENTVSYRYRAWLTSGGASGAWTSTTGTTATITGLAAGAYTAEVYAYSAGGASATDTATATVTAPAGWTTIAADDFTATDGTVMDGRVSPTGSKTWTLNAGPAVTIAANKLTWSATGYTAQDLRLALGGDNTGGVAVEFDYTGGFIAGIAVASPPHYAGFNLDAGSNILYPAGGYPPTEVTGTTTGLATSGRARLELVGTAMTFSIDGVVKTTATAAEGIKGNYVTLHLINGGSIDNVAVEVYA